MQACFYRLSGVLPLEDAMATLRSDIGDLYKHKG